MADTVGVRFTRSGRVYYFDPGDHELSVGDRVLVETDDGRREGEVVIEPSQIAYSDLRGPMNPVVQKLAE